MPAPVEPYDEEEELRRQRKAAKKQRKRREREEVEQQQLSDTLPATPQSQPPTTETDNARLQRKADKRERKRLRRQQQQQQATEEADPIRGDRVPRTPSEATAYRAAHRILISEADAHILPVTSFASAGFPSDLLSATSTFTQPTPIQAQCWPVLLQRRDCIAIADTGSGKTLGFVLPGLTRLLTSAPPLLPAAVARQRGTFSSGASGPLMLILSPTRELALQTAAVVTGAASSTPLRTAVIYGGVDKREQIRSLDPVVHTVVATPGRLLALLDDRALSLRRVELLVLDEADRMLDMGFEEDVRAILGQLGDTGMDGVRRQTVMFSATWPTSVQRLANEFIHDPVHISIGDIELRANARVSQTVTVLQTDNDKPPRLLSILSQHPTSRILIFVLYKKEINFVERLVSRHGHRCVAISGDKSQSDRESSIMAFKSKKIPILIATDVVGRGLDIDDVDLVINFTFPLTVEDYVHRIGRTGRGGKNGASVTFFTKNEKHLSGELINVLRQGGEEVPKELIAFGTGVKRKEHGFFGQHFKKITEGDSGEMKKPTKVKFDD